MLRKSESTFYVMGFFDPIQLGHATVHIHVRFVRIYSWGLGTQYKYNSFFL